MPIRPAGDGQVWVADEDGAIAGLIVLEAGFERVYLAKTLGGAPY